jgi:hypothetical protein
MRFATLCVALLAMSAFGESKAMAQQRVIFQQPRSMFQQPRATFQQARSTFQQPLATFQVPAPIPASYTSDIWILPAYLSDQLAATTDTTQPRFPAARIRQFYWGGPPPVVLSQSTVPSQPVVTSQPTIPGQPPIVIQTTNGDQGSQNGDSQK